MMKLTLPCAALVALAPASGGAPAAGNVPRYSSANRTIGTLLNDSRARAIIDRHIPSISTDGRITFARGLTLKGIQRFAQGKVTDNNSPRSMLIWQKLK